MTSVPVLRPVDGRTTVMLSCLHEQWPHGLPSRDIVDYLTLCCASDREQMLQALTLASPTFSSGIYCKGEFS